MSKSSIEITVVIPLYKCSRCIKELYIRLTGNLSKVVNERYEIIFVNDGSPENDWEVIDEVTKNDLNVKAINLSRNFGQHYAITAGLDYVKGEWIVVMDGDLQDRPEEIIKLYNKVLEGFDIVVGVREDRHDKVMKRLSSYLFGKVYSFLTDVELNNKIGNFGIYSKKVINSVKTLKEQNRSFGLFVNWVGYKRAEISIKHSERYIGETSYNLNKLLALAFDSIIAHSNKLLRITIKIGFIISFLAFLYGIIIILRYLIFDIKVEGWSSLIVSLYFLAGLILSAIGVVGIYIDKIFNEVKDRPLYLVSETINIDTKD